MQRVFSWSHGCDQSLSFSYQFYMNLTLQEVDHLLKALETMSAHDVARARELIAPGVAEHGELIQKLKDYRLRLT